MDVSAEDLGLIMDKTVKLEWHKLSNTRTRCLRITQASLPMLLLQPSAFLLPQYSHMTSALCWNKNQKVLLPGWSLLLWSGSYLRPRNTSQYTS